MMDDEYKEVVVNAPNAPNAEFMEGLVCDCCGEKIMEMNSPVCLITPYDCVCIYCLRSTEELRTNGNNYRLRKQYESEWNRCNRLLSERERAIYSSNQSLEELNNYKNSMEEAMQELYEDALKTDSAAAIELAKSFREKFQKKCECD